MIGQPDGINCGDCGAKVENPPSARCNECWDCKTGANLNEENIVEANTYKENPAQEASLEQAKQDAIAKQAPVFDPVATASQIFEYYFPIYCKQMDKLSRKQLLRLGKAVIGLPLEEGFKPNLKNKEEMQAYFVLERLFQAKMILITAAMQDKMRKQDEKALESKPEETNELPANF